ncbi:MAG: type II secretion system protein GspN [Nitrospirota bacterium]|nr:type II secretion system protein GspN [Nitrospirota bacterium]
MKFRPGQSLYAVPVGWTLYTFMMVVICLVLTFPYDPLHATLLLRLAERSGLDIHTERWGLRLPAGVVWTHPSILVPGLERIDAEEIQVEVKLGSLLRGQPVLAWSGHVGERDGSYGLLKGELSMASLSWKGPAQILGSVEHLDLSHLALPLVKKGLLRGRFERRWTDLSEASRSSLEEGTWHLEVTELALEQLPIGLQSLSSLTLSSLSGRLECHSGTCRLESFRGESQDGMFSGEGELVVQDPFSTSHLTLTLSVIMTEALKERLHLTSLGPGTPGLPQKITLSGPLSSLQVSL